MTEERIKEIVEGKLQKAYGFDPLTIITVISILIQAYKLYKKCKSTDTLLKRNVRRNGLASRIFFRKVASDLVAEAKIDPVVADEIVEEFKAEYLKD